MPEARSSPRHTSGWSLATRDRSCPRTPGGTPSTSCQRWPSTMPRSSRRPGSDCARSCRTPTSVSRSCRPSSPCPELAGYYRAALGHDVDRTNLQRILVRREQIEPTGSGCRPGLAAADRRLFSGSGYERFRSPTSSRSFTRPAVAAPARGRVGARGLDRGSVRDAVGPKVDAGSTANSSIAASSSAVNVIPSKAPRLASSCSTLLAP